VFGAPEAGIQYLETADLFLTDEQKSAFRKHMFSFRAHYAWLAFETAEAGRLGWSLVQKFHYCCHMPDQADYINPRVTWSYAGESMVGLIAALGHACLAGTPAHRVSVSLIAKYRIAMHLQLAKQT
jgi:hypothetical protein